MIYNAGSVPLNKQPQGDVPDVSGALTSYFQPMVFERVTKTNTGFQAVEVGNPLNFQGVIMPFNQRQLLMKPEGERAWTWWMLFAELGLLLQVDDVVIWRGKQYRVMTRGNYELYGYAGYEIVTDWTGSGPT